MDIFRKFKTSIDRREVVIRVPGNEASFQVFRAGVSIVLEAAAVKAGLEFMGEGVDQRFLVEIALSRVSLFACGRFVVALLNVKEEVLGLGLGDEDFAVDSS